MAVQQLHQTFLRLRSAIASQQQFATDRELLRAFSTNGDQDAFTELIGRHGCLVHAVARRVLGNNPAVDDVWQATFLLLARRAHSLKSKASVAAWLHGVAYRIALNERRSTRRRLAREANAPIAAVPPVEREAAWRELQELVDVEIQRLPRRLREVFVRCCLQTEGCAEVATEIGVKAATVRSRLTRARRIIRIRLERKGVCLSAALTLVALANDRVSANVMAATVRAAAVGALNRHLPSELISIRASNLLAEADRGVRFARWTFAALILLAGAVGFGVAQLPGKATDPPTPKSPTILPDAQRAKAENTDPLPAGALVRFGTLRFSARRLRGIPRVRSDGQATRFVGKRVEHV